MAENRIEAMTVDEILSGIRAEAARRRETPSAGNAPLPRSSNDSYEKAEFAVKDRYHISEFLAFHDKQFIINAYQGMLRRYPDENGLRNFLSHLRRGQLSKPEIIGRFRYSPEGRRHKIKVDGLMVPLALELLSRIPLIGWLLRMLYEVAVLPDTIRAFRQEEGSLHCALSDTRRVNRYLENKLSGLEHALLDQMDLLENQLNGQIADINSRLTDYSEQMAATQDHVAGLTAQSAVLKEGLDVQEGLRDALRQEFQAGLDDLGKLLAQLDERKADVRSTEALQQQLIVEKQGLLEQQRAFIRFLEDARKRLPEPFNGDDVAAIAEEETHVLDDLYIAFQEQFRGTRLDIRNAQKVYLPLIRQVKAIEDGYPILDVGCGRGEWLEVLKAAQIKAVGVDINRAMIRQCRELGVEVHEGDVSEFLKETPPGSLGLISGFHIIEHIPFSQLITLFDACLEALHPGGAVLFETPNPGNLAVGSNHFYLDPTHRNPLPSKLVKFLLQARGFIDVAVYGVAHSQNGGPRLRPLNLDLSDFNAIVSEPHDYAVIAHKMS